MSEPTTIVTRATAPTNSVLLGPRKAANADGVAASALEMQENAARDAGPFEQTEARLAAVMRDVHAQSRVTAETYGGNPEDRVLGADVARFLRVAQAMTAQGVI
ncbi:hypothetical protein ACWGF2_04755 [Streptomyces sp. NPDC054919]